MNLPKELLNSLREEQHILQTKVHIIPLKQKIDTLAGCDSSFLDQDTILSVFVVFTYPDLKEIEVAHWVSPVPLPYIPGFLGFREIPNLLNAYKKLKNKPDLIMVDGHGIMHPRGLGIASHLGIMLNIPTIGVAKKKLFGVYEEPDVVKGSYSPVYIPKQNVHIGFALQSKDKVKPIFVSPGHLCNFEDALSMTLTTLKKHKLPEPTRVADMYTKNLKR